MGEAPLALAPEAVGVTDLEARRMRLLNSPFVQSIDFTLIPCDGRLLLKSQEENVDRLLGIKALQALITDIYQSKKADDSKRDKAHQPRKELHVVLQEMLKRQHGVKRVVHQKSWQLVE